MPTKRLNCEYEGCDKSYCSTFNLKRHIEIIHLGLRRFKCTICGRMLSSKQNLLDHQNIHTGARPYVCEVPDCRHPFRQLSQYYLHRQLHNQVGSQMNTTNLVSSSLLSLLANKITVDSGFTNYTLIQGENHCEELPKITFTGEFKSLPLLESLKF